MFHIFNFRAMYFSAVGIAVLGVLLTTNALVIFAVYADCDLLESKKITRNDQVTIIWI